MLEKIKIKIKKNTEIFALSILIMITVISTTFYNQSKKKIINNYKSTINNVYLKKTLNHFFDNLEPKFKVINHKITSGETFQNILIACRCFQTRPDSSKTHSSVSKQGSRVPKNLEKITKIFF